MSTKSVQKYIEIVPAGNSPSGITRRWKVIQKREGITVGTIKWYGGFRKYCFFPAEDTMLYDSDFLKLVAEKLEKENKHQRGKAHYSWDGKTITYLTRVQLGPRKTILASRGI